jgi:hypothetical protein
MGILASAGHTAKVIVVVVGIVLIAGFVVWKACAVAKAAKTKGTPEEKQKAIGNAMFGGGGAYGKGHDFGRKIGEKLGSLFKRKGK